MTEFFILFVAGLFSGVFNAIAGGGSFISFPALLFVGVPPVFANATNTYASFAGYVSGAWAMRQALLKEKILSGLYALMGLFGGALGGYILLRFSNASFSKLIPWLLLIATLLFAFGPSLSAWFKARQTTPTNALKVFTIGSILILFASVYGGFFNAGLGIVLLSVCALTGLKDMQLMNGLKLLVSATVSLSAIVVFIIEDMIAWYLGSILLLGNMLGAYGAARLSSFASDKAMRNLVLSLSVILTLYFFVVEFT